ncbi:hypothetical protein MTR67_013493 [Solanum verrucosum]|uniref:Uncharacterized protein n=1 Tax=Solanum verrucosum TaxID=315347 RepID=A0AAF0TM05_SOLVR|nr:hypothetical protein MTR67_013493 [Solanum verrucosum]
MTTVYPVPYYLNDPKNDETGINYEVNGILMVNGGGCHDFIFYITSCVKTSDGKDIIFQAKVMKDLNYCLPFPVIRPKAGLAFCYKAELFWLIELFSRLIAMESLIDNQK